MQQRPQQNRFPEERSPDHGDSGSDRDVALNTSDRSSVNSGVGAATNSSTSNNSNNNNNNNNIRQSTASRIVQTCSLYSPECYHWLQRALEIAQATAAATQPDYAAPGRPYYPSSYEYKGSRYADSSSSSSSSEGEKDEDNEEADEERIRDAKVISNHGSDADSQEDSDGADGAQRIEPSSTFQQEGIRNDGDNSNCNQGAIHRDGELGDKRCGLDDDDDNVRISTTRDDDSPSMPHPLQQRTDQPPNKEKPNARRAQAVSNADQRQRQRTIQKHWQMLPTFVLPLPLDATNMIDTNKNHNKLLELPAALLTKEIRQFNGLHHNEAQRILSLCQAYHSHAFDLIEQKKPVVVLLLRSGYFAGAVFQHDQCLVHATAQRYTVRKKQGKAQSSQDSQRRAQSTGAQLRRAGELQLQVDVANIITSWRAHFESACLIFLSCPNTMKKGLFDVSATSVQDIFSRDDPRLRRVPLDFGRPTFDSARLVYQTVMMTAVVVAAVAPESYKGEANLPTATTNQDDDEEQVKMRRFRLDKNTQQPHSDDAVVGDPTDSAAGTVIESAAATAMETFPPLTPLHEAAQHGDATTIRQLLEHLSSLPERELEPQSYAVNETNNNIKTSAIVAVEVPNIQDWINARAGEDGMTPLHIAAVAPLSTMARKNKSATSNLDDHDVDAIAAAECVLILLTLGHANPCLLDKTSHRVPYLMSSHDKIREAFRMARAQLGEKAWDWDGQAKVGPPLTQQDVHARQIREAEKRKKKRSKQKEKKAQDKAQAVEAERLRLDQQQQQQMKEEAKRIRDGLRPKPAVIVGGALCDYCQSVCMGRKRNQMFHRLEYAYCSTDCVQKHKRELMASAAIARMNNSNNV